MLPGEAVHYVKQQVFFALLVPLAFHFTDANQVIRRSTVGAPDWRVTHLWSVATATPVMTATPVATATPVSGLQGWLHYSHHRLQLKSFLGW